MDAPFESILAPAGKEHVPPADLAEPLHDLNLDQVIAEITAAWPDAGLAAWFQVPLAELDAIRYRQEVMRDLQTDPVRISIEAFVEGLGLMRRQLDLAAKADYRQERERRFLDAVAAYCHAVDRLGNTLTPLPLTSRGLQALRHYVTGLAASPPFALLRNEATSLLHDLVAIRYCLRIRDNKVTVLPYRDEPDYGQAIEAVFAKFRNAPSRDLHVMPAGPDRLGHVDAQILERVAWLNPGPFARLEQFCTRRATFADPVILRFGREVTFYLAYLKLIEPLRRGGLRFCLPRLSARRRGTVVRGAFDLGLALRLVPEARAVVTNDLHLAENERILVVSGPNHGGKTTFARMFGQLHYLACLGVPVPAAVARLPLTDRVFTHFARPEKVDNQQGQLMDELRRLRRTLEQATACSLVILNELFASTTLADARTLSRRVLAKILATGSLAVCVTFVEELAADGAAVSMVGIADPSDPTQRTFRFERRPANGMAYALALAEKYGVTFDALRRRIRP